MLSAIKMAKGPNNLKRVISHAEIISKEFLSELMICCNHNGKNISEMASLPKLCYNSGLNIEGGSDLGKMMGLKK